MCIFEVRKIESLLYKTCGINFSKNTIGYLDKIRSICTLLKISRTVLGRIFIIVFLSSKLFALFRIIFFVPEKSIKLFINIFSQVKHLADMATYTIENIKNRRKKNQSNGKCHDIRKIPSCITISFKLNPIINFEKYFVLYILLKLA